MEEYVQEILERIKKIQHFYVKGDLEESAIEWDEESYLIYRKNCKGLVKSITEVVKLQEKPFDFKDYLEEIPDRKFWEMIQREVGRQTESFLRAVPYRRLDGEERMRLLKKAFDVIYLQRENQSYLEDLLQDNEMATALNEILQASEHMVIKAYASKRRLREFLEANLRIESQDAAYIWDLYEHNFEDILRMVSQKSMLRLGQQINLLAERIEHMEGFIYFVFGRDEDNT